MNFTCTTCRKDKSISSLKQRGLCWKCFRSTKRDTAFINHFAYDSSQTHDFSTLEIFAFLNTGGENISIELKSRPFDCRDKVIGAAISMAPYWLFRLIIGCF